MRPQPAARRPGEAAVAAAAAAGCYQGYPAERLSVNCSTMVSPKRKSSYPKLPTYSQEVFHSAVGVVEGSTHGRLDLASLESHRLHVRNGLGPLSTHSQARAAGGRASRRGISRGSRRRRGGRNGGRLRSGGGGRSRCRGSSLCRSSRRSCRRRGLGLDHKCQPTDSGTNQACEVGTYLVHHADDIALLFDLVGADSLLILENLACKLLV